MPVSSKVEVRYTGTLTAPVRGSGSWPAWTARVANFGSGMIQLLASSSQLLAYRGEIGLMFLRVAGSAIDPWQESGWSRCGGQDQNSEDHNLRQLLPKSPGRLRR